MGEEHLDLFAQATTLLALVPRFYDPVAGRILLDGQPLSGMTLDSRRHQIGTWKRVPGCNRVEKAGPTL